MPYVSGESPLVGDYVKNKWEQPGTVVEVNEDRIAVRWDDGGNNLPLTPAAGFTLISRQ